MKQVKENIKIMARVNKKLKDMRTKKDSADVSNPDNVTQRKDTSSNKR